MIVVTGAAGFIGSNLVRALNRRGERDVVAVDDLSAGAKFANLAGCDLADYLDEEELIATVRSGRDVAPRVRAVFHQGACSDTTEWDGRYVMRRNYAYSRDLLHHCQERRIPFLYASSAAVYGGTGRFVEDPAAERPLNVYGFSKLVLDQHVRRRLGASRSQVVGLRYFNVYGPGESHKGAMASVALHLHHQVAGCGVARLFEGTDGYADGEQRRDFVHVDDVVAVNLWFMERRDRSGVFNVGTGRSRSFNAVARAVLAHHGGGRIEYFPMPEALRGRYQSFTEADLGGLRRAGYRAPFLDVEEGVARYLEALALPAV